MGCPCHRDLTWVGARPFPTGSIRATTGMPHYPVRGNSIPLPGCPRWLVKPYQEFAFLTTPEGGATSVTGHEPIHRATPPPPAGRRGGFRAATAPRGRPPVKADRGVYAAPYPATAKANTITVHTITPAIVIRTVCFHMVSIPHFRLMLRGTLDQHDPARSDGRHREFFSGGRWKNEKNGPAREPVWRPCLFADAEGAGDKIQLLPQRRQRPRL